MRHSLEIDSSSIHHSQLRIIATMLNKGLPDEEVVEKVMAATKTARGRTRTQLDLGRRAAQDSEHDLGVV
jgi:hypothetical protein